MANCVWDELGLRIAINCQCNGLIEIQKSNIFRGEISVIGFRYSSLFTGGVRGRHPKLYFQSSFLWCDWRTECLEDCPLTPGLGLEQPRPAWPRHSSLGLAPRSRGRGQSGRWDEAVMSSGLQPWPRIHTDTLHSGLRVANKPTKLYKKILVVYDMHFYF